MVMHARKTQRMNDGYFEKHQAHPYQNSKYSSSKGGGGGYGSSSDRYERIRDSPNGNYRSDNSPDSQSPRDRDRERERLSYQSKGSYLQKIREKERENRDYKMSRDKYTSDCGGVRSPKDKRRESSTRDSSEQHRTNIEEKSSILHPIKMSQSSSNRDRKPIHNNSSSASSSSLEKSSRGDDRDRERDRDRDRDRDRVVRVGDWSEHVSSSGKKYYYNCKTEVSQWEKPREWIDREQRSATATNTSTVSTSSGSSTTRTRDRDRDRDSDRCYSGRSGSMRHEKHSNSTRGGVLGVGGGGINSRHWSSSSSRDDSDVVTPKDTSSSRRSSSSKSHSNSNQGIVIDENMQSSTQDMDISPGDSTPTSEMSYNSSSHHPHHLMQQQHTTSNNGSGENAALIIGPVLLANALPRLISTHPPSVSSPQNTTGIGTTITTTATTSNAPGPPPGSGGGGGHVHIENVLKQTSGDSSAVHSSNSSLSVDIINNHLGSNNIVEEGPPTPTHSETADCCSSSKGVVVSVPVSSPPISLQGVSSSLQALRAQGPTITPSLVNYYRDDLVNHVRGWPAEILEKQANKLAEEAHIMGSIQCSKVSAELKSARSIVRLTEIQATLQEQRILFLRQQIKELEELKSQNSFMSDDS